MTNTPTTQMCEALVRNNTADLLVEIGQVIGSDLCKDTG